MFYTNGAGHLFRGLLLCLLKLTSSDPTIRSKSGLAHGEQHLGASTTASNSIRAFPEDRQQLRT
eukprot:1159731-Pelagomonas_calceolata.AAC.3